eukprot:TRINITY_DN27069_c0_g1_i2.p1 TRINITY_DN27069_c0_g1~~TRINITY_DN27069_c0_g1_i2.p1  ORF type:complete len:198 (-),score=49.40 TRINITY_DN27069_c0_g1_i2:238-771(-)
MCIRDRYMGIEANDFPRYNVKFPTPPEVYDSTMHSVSVRLQLDNFGWVFVTCIKQADDLTKPTAYQVYRGYNYRNLQVRSAKFEVSVKYKDVNFTIDELEDDTPYTIYVVGGSAHPGYPDLMPDKHVLPLTFKTLPVPKIMRLDINQGVKMEPSYLLMTFALMLTFFISYHAELLHG